MPPPAFHMFEAKLITAGLLGIADAVSDSPFASWESLGLKTALILAIIWLVRELNAARKEAKEEAQEREAKLVLALNNNTTAKDEQTRAMWELKNSTDLQTQYFKTVAQQLINTAIHPKLPEE